MVRGKIVVSDIFMKFMLLILPLSWEWRLNERVNFRFFLYSSKRYNFITLHKNHPNITHLESRSIVGVINEFHVLPQNSKGLETVYLQWALDALRWRLLGFVKEEVQRPTKKLGQSFSFLLAFSDEARFLPWGWGWSPQLQKLSFGEPNWFALPNLHLEKTNGDNSSLGWNYRTLKYAERPKE